MSSKATFKEEGELSDEDVNKRSKSRHYKHHASASVSNASPTRCSEQQKLKDKNSSKQTSHSSGTYKKRGSSKETSGPRPYDRQSHRRKESRNQRRVTSPSVSDGGQRRSKDNKESDASPPRERHASSPDQGHKRGRDRRVSPLCDSQSNHTPYNSKCIL